MAKQTRSNTILTGEISDYLLESSNLTTMSTNGDEANTSGSGRANNIEDMQSLLTLMARTLTAMTQDRPTHSASNLKLDDCPIKRKECNLEAWMDEVLLWNESYSSNDPGFNSKKYLKLVESIRKSEECVDVQNFVQVEFVENSSFDKKQDNIIAVMINKMKTNLGQTDLEKCSEAWSKFINIRQDTVESTKSYVN